MRKHSWLLSTSAIACAMVLLAVSLSGCGGGAPNVDWELKINGAVDKPLTLTYKDLAGMSRTELTDILMEKSEGEDQITSWEGVPLEDIFEQAGANPDYVGAIALAADGYAVEISRDELADAIVALKDAGEWIATADEEHGPIRLVCPYTPANRWVFQLLEIQVVGP
jgi:DMSO/TMAO reductase YedYZ molybdopterin-dependent catalytic subunit